MSAHSLPRFADRHGDAASRTRWALAGGTVVAVHLAAGWGLLQMKAVRDVVAERAPMFVDLVAPPAPPALSEPREPAPRPAPAPPAAPKPVQRRLSPVPPALVAAPVPPVAAAPSPAPAPLPAAPLPPATPTPAAAPAVAEAAPVAPAPLPAAPPAPPAPPQPKTVPPSAAQYLVPPSPVYPATSSRLRETGTVVVRVLIGTDGSAREAHVQQSSGYPRLDAAAVAAVRGARFRPYTENGQALAVWTTAPIEFELEK